MGWRKENMKVGFIGVGFMGQHMAKHIVDGGHDLTIYDDRTWVLR